MKTPVWQIAGESAPDQFLFNLNGDEHRPLLRMLRQPLIGEAEKRVGALGNKGEVKPIAAPQKIPQGSVVRHILHGKIGKVVLKPGMVTLENNPCQRTVDALIGG